MLEGFFCTTKITQEYCENFFSVPLTLLVEDKLIVWPQWTSKNPDATMSNCAF